MSRARGGLGRGLAALIPTGPSTSTVTEAFMNGRPDGTNGTHGTTTDNTEEVANATSSTLRIVDSTSVAGDSTAPDAKHTSSAAGTAGTTADRPSAKPDLTEVTHDPDRPRYAEIPTAEIRPNPRNPRSAFDEDSLAELEHSVREFGLLQPIVVRPVPGGYELVMGERRWRAAQRAGLGSIPAIIRRTEDAALLRDALLENIHRANLNPLEEAAAYQQLLEEFDVTQDELASRIGRSRPVISNTIRLLRLPVAVQRRVAAGVLSAGHARALLSLENPGDQEDLATRVVAEGLSVRGTEEAVVLLAGRTVRSRRTSAPKRELPDLTDLAGTLSDTFDTRVRLELGRQKGRMVVEFASVEDLRRIVSLMTPNARRTSDEPMDGLATG